MTTLHADEAYLGHYQFSHDPFAPRVPGFKFFPAQRKPVLGQLHHLARYSQLLLVVCGQQGSGKTLLRQALVASTNKQTVQSIVVSPRGSNGGVMEQIAEGLGVSQPGVSGVLAQVAQLALIGQEVYLLVDDAEQLDDGALETLLLLAAGNAEGRPHVFLFGESTLIPRLERLSAGQERFHAIELQPYGEEETRDYLAQRLEGAGQGIELLSAEQIEDIHQQSGGWPGAINQIARDVLVEAMLASNSAARARGFALSGLPIKHLVALLVVAIGVGAAWLMQGSDEQVSAPPVAQLPMGEAASPAPQAEVIEPDGPAIEFDGATQPLPLPLVGEAQPVIREPLAQAAGLNEDEGEGDVESLPSAAAGEMPAAAPVVAEPSAVSAPAPAAVPSEPAVAPAAVVAAPASKPAPAPAIAPEAPAKPPVAKPAPSAPAAGAPDDWYRTQAASSYALQVFGSRSESTAQAFVRELGGEYRYFKKMHQGQPLYVVTYGSFGSRAAAQAAIKALPAKVQAGKPWPRTFASIQQEALLPR